MLFHCTSPDSFLFHTYTIQSQSQFNLNKIYFSFLFLQKINYLRLNQLFSHIYPRTKKSRLFPKSLENKRLRPLCYFIELLVIFDEIWTTDFCVSELHPHNHLYVYTTGNCLFLVFSFTLRKQDMSLKVPKFKEFQVFFLWSIVTVSTCIETLLRINIRAQFGVSIVFCTPICKSQKVAPFRRTK